MKKKNLFLLILIVIFSISFSACSYGESGNEGETLPREEVFLNSDEVTDNKMPKSLEERQSLEEVVPIEETISHALQRLANSKVWFSGENTWGFFLLNKEVGYEYYKKKEYITTVGSEGYIDKIAVLLTETVPIAPIEAGNLLAEGINEEYMIFEMFEEEWNELDVYAYSRWYRRTLEECREILVEKGYTKVGESNIVFGAAEKPDYGENSEEKLEIVRNIAQKFMATIGSPEKTTELYILNFDITSITHPN